MSKYASQALIPPIPQYNRLQNKLPPTIGEASSQPVFYSHCIAIISNTPNTVDFHFFSAPLFLFFFPYSSSLTAEKIPAEIEHDQIHQLAELRREEPDQPAVAQVEVRQLRELAQLGRNATCTHRHVKDGHSEANNITTNGP